MRMGFERSKLLPPPAGTIVTFAAYGVAARNGLLAPSGRPRLPEKRDYIPVFYEMVRTAEGLKQLEELAGHGMRAWELSHHIIDLLPAIFRDRHFLLRLPAVLEEFAATARKACVIPQQSRILLAAAGGPEVPPLSSAPDPAPAAPVKPSAAPASPGARRRRTPRTPHEYANLSSQPVAYRPHPIDAYRIARQRHPVRIS